MNFPQQQPPSMFPFLDEIEQRVHPVTAFVLAAIGAVGGYFYGLTNPRFPLVIFIIVGLLGGLLAVVLIKHLVGFIIAATLVAIAGFGAFWLFNHQDTLRRERANHAQQTEPAPKAHSWKDDLRGVL